MFSPSGRVWCKLDLSFVVDKTHSIREQNIPKLKAALTLLLRQFDVSEHGTHVCLETFAKESTLQKKFNDVNYRTKDAVLELLDSIGPLGKPTRLDPAIQKANEEMFTEESGDRPGVLNMMVLVTDGRSRPDTDFAEYMRHVRAIKVRQPHVLTSFNP